MTKRPLFDVVLAVHGDDDTGTGIYDVRIIDRYRDSGSLIGHKSDLTSLDEAMQFARGAVSAFMRSADA